MKKLICLVLSVMLAVSAVSTLAETIVGGTGNKPSSVPIEWEQRTMDESIVPFAKLSWGMTEEEVIAVINAHYTVTDNKIETKINIPRINDSKTVVFSFDKEGLERISIILFDSCADFTISVDGFTTKVKDFRTVPDVDCLLKIVDEFYNTNGAYKIQLDHQKDGKYACTAYFTDNVYMVIGKIQKENMIGVEFIKPKKFDEGMIRNSNHYDISLANIKSFNIQGENRTTLYQCKTGRMIGFDTNYSKVNARKHTFNVMISAIEMRFSFLNPNVTFPVFYFCYGYSGIAKPENVKSFNFVIDNQLYAFMPSAATKTSVTEYREYQKNFYFAVGEKNAAFMEALSKASSPIHVQIMGDNGFIMDFDLPEETRKQLVDDWNLYIEAGGTFDFFLLNSMEQACIIR